jgi:hypothetical protein
MDSLWETRSATSRTPGGSQDQDEETCYVWLLTTWIALRGRSAVP